MLPYNESEEEKREREERERQNRVLEEARRQAAEVVNNNTNHIPAAPAFDENVNNSYTQTGSFGGSDSVHEGTTINNQQNNASSVSYRDVMPKERQQELENKQKAYAAINKMDYDPTTGELKPTNKFLTTILGVDPAIMRRRRLDEMEINREKQKQSAFFNAISVLGDMITAATGGNVEKREANNAGKEANERNQQLTREQNEEDKANADKTNNKLQQVLDKIENMSLQWNQLYAPTVHNSQSSGSSIGRQISTQRSKTYNKSGSRTQSESTLTTPIQSNSDQEKRLYGGKGDVAVAMMNTQGKLETKYVSKEQAKVLASHAKAVYNAKIAQGDRRLAEVFISRGIVRLGTNDNLVWDDEMLLKSGYLFATSDGNMQSISSIESYYRSITGENRPFRQHGSNNSSNDGGMFNDGSAGVFN